MRGAEARQGGYGLLLVGLRPDCLPMISLCVASVQLCVCVCGLPCPNVPFVLARCALHWMARISQDAVDAHVGPVPVDCELRCSFFTSLECLDAVMSLGRKLAYRRSHAWACLCTRACLCMHDVEHVGVKMPAACMHGLFR